MWCKILGVVVVERYRGDDIGRGVVFVVDRESIAGTHPFGHCNFDSSVVGQVHSDCVPRTHAGRDLDFDGLFDFAGLIVVH